MSFLAEDEVDLLIRANENANKNEQNEEQKRHEYPEYQLQDEWTLWFGRWDAPKQVLCFDTINVFWALFNNIKSPTMLPPKMDYHLFLNGIAPKCEDEQNKSGGSLSVECSLEEINQFWLYSCLALIGNNFTHGKIINGLMINVRPKFGRIQMWTTATDRSKEEISQLEKTAKEWKDFIQASKKQQIKFTTHEQIFLHNDTKPKIIF